MSRPHPHLAIPPGARQPAVPSPSITLSPYAFELSTPTADNSFSNPWEEEPLYEPSSPVTPHISSLDIPPRPQSRTQSVYEPHNATFSFPEPQIYRSVSQRSTLRPSPKKHRQSKSDLGPSVQIHQGTSVSSAVSVASTVSSYYPAEESFPQEFETASVFSRELSNLSLDSEEGLRRFQAGELPEADEEWYRLVPEEAREALGEKEVQRQSVLFEVFKSERDYVSDLEVVSEVFINNLRNADPPAIPEDRIGGFISEVFWNLDQILAHHQRMLGALFERQREQHPLIQSVADIILDTSLLFRSEYESYIKHYPLAEARHRTELKRNSKYHAFIQECSQDPRIRKRDLITFLSRPVTRLPRLNLLLENVLKRTDPEHPDIESIPLILSILSDFIKSTQPGIQAAESKVKFWNLCESLVYQRGEIIDMDLYDESRTLVYSGPLARKQRSDIDWHGWTDLFVALLDNHLLLTREEKRPNGALRRHVASRPLPLDYLQLGSFTGAAENRKEVSNDAGILESFCAPYKPVYPFTVYHESAKSSRRYTLYAVTAAVRKKWHDALVDAIGVHKARREANMWFAPQALNDRMFRFPGPRVPYSASVRFTGKITCAAPFTSGERRYLAVSCATGLYVAPRGDSNYQKVLNLPNATSMSALEGFNKLLIHYESQLISYSLDLLARAAQGQSSDQNLRASMEKLAGQDGNVLFFRVGRIANRTLIIYASKSFLQVTLQALEAVRPSEGVISARRDTNGSRSFRAFGSSFNVPKDAYDCTPLVKTVAISTEKGIVIADPTNFGKSVVAVIPNWNGASTNLPLYTLKSRCDDAKALGLVQCGNSELLVIYDTVGCYITKHGVPCRSSGYIRWESKATSFAHSENHILLFSPQFIEIRNTNTGRLVQVIEGGDIRLLHYGAREGTKESILVAMKGDKDDNEGVSDKIVELVATSAINNTTSATDSEALWDEWDMS